MISRLLMGTACLVYALRREDALEMRNLLINVCESGMNRVLGILMRSPDLRASYLTWNCLDGI